MTDIVINAFYNKIIGGGKMRCEGRFITGGGKYFTLLKGEEKNQKKLAAIMYKLNNLTSYDDDFIVVDLVENIQDFDREEYILDSETVVFFQAVRGRDYNCLNQFFVEIRVDLPDNYQMYRRSVRKTEMLQIFQEVCIKRKIPKLKGWNKFYDKKRDGAFENRPDNTDNTDEHKEEIFLNREIARKWWLDELPENDYPIYVDAIEFLMDNGGSSDMNYQETYFLELEKRGLRDKLMERYKSLSSPVAADMIGLSYLYGTGGVTPDYKKAYGYFY